MGYVESTHEEDDPWTTIYGPDGNEYPYYDRGRKKTVVDATYFYCDHCGVWGEPRVVTRRVSEGGCLGLVGSCMWGLGTFLFVVGMLFFPLWIIAIPLMLLGRLFGEYTTGTVGTSYCRQCSAEISVGNPRGYYLYHVPKWYRDQKQD